MRCMYGMCIRYKIARVFHETLSLANVCTQLKCAVPTAF